MQWNNHYKISLIKKRKQMNKINSIHIAGTRGIKDSLILNLNKKSILLYGDNGSGKSSITDAFEWFFYDRVEHLTSEEIESSKGKGALRNLFLKGTETAFIKIDFLNSELNSQKTINNSLKIAQTNTTPEYSNYLLSTQSENLILRYRDLVSFIIATKKEKLDSLQKIIGFNEVGEIRDLLRKNAGRIARNIKANNYDNKKSIQQSILLDNIGQNITSAKQFFEVANNLIEPLKLKLEIKDYSSIQEVLKEIAEKVDNEIIEKISFLNKVNENLSEIFGNIDSIDNEYKLFFDSLNELKKEKGNFEKLQLLNLLLEAQQLFKKEIIKEDYCPLCRQEKNRTELIQDINKRIEDFEAIKSEKEKVEQKATEFKQKIQLNINILNSLITEKLFKKEENKELFVKINEIRTSLENYIVEIQKNILTANDIKKPSELLLSKDKIQKTSTDSKTAANSLVENQKKNPKLQIHTKLSLATQAYSQYNRIVKEETILRNQQRTFEALYADFIKRQEIAINTFLEMFSKDINEHYT